MYSLFSVSNSQCIKPLKVSRGTRLVAKQFRGLCQQGFKHQGNTQKTHRFFFGGGGQPVEKNSKNTHQFQFVTSVVIKDFFTFMASNDQ